MVWYIIKIPACINMYESRLFWGIMSSHADLLNEARMVIVTNKAIVKPTYQVTEDVNFLDICQRLTIKHIKLYNDAYCGVEKRWKVMLAKWWW